MNRINKVASQLSPGDRDAKLTIWDVTNPNAILYKQTLSNIDEIKAYLNKRSVGFDVWPLKNIEGHENNDNKILETYSDEINNIMKKFQFQTYDIVHVTKENSTKIRNGFLTEHIHPTEEVRLYVRGCLYYYIHFPEINEVIRIVTPKGCLIVLPSLARHWADIGNRCDLIVIRFFGTKEGWSAHYTNSNIEKKFPLQSPL